ncbi:hypothetical protein Hanom_Chr02g00130291 [Helianthus anomalus]
MLSRSIFSILDPDHHPFLGCLLVFRRLNLVGDQMCRKKRGSKFFDLLIFIRI